MHIRMQHQHVNPACTQRIEPSVGALALHKSRYRASVVLGEFPQKLVAESAFQPVGTSHVIPEDDYAGQFFVRECIVMGTAWCLAALKQSRGRECHYDGQHGTSEDSCGVFSEFHHLRDCIFCDVFFPPPERPRGIFELPPPEFPAPTAEPDDEFFLPGST